MSVNGPILILEDDQDDQEILEMVFRELLVRNERRYFERSETFIQYLSTTQEKPLIIFSDINMVKANGLELKKEIEADPYLKAKSIPYVFMTTSANPVDVKTAYESNTQGFFVKPSSLDSMKTIISYVLFYWKNSLHPNNT